MTLPARPLRLVLGPGHRAALAAAAQAAWPEECCGLIVGRRRAAADGAASLTVTRLVPAANRHATPRIGFELDPATHFTLLRTLRAAGDGDEVLLGHYHSHPDAAARPSPRDAAQAWDEAMIWVVVGLAGSRVEAITAWQVATPARPDGTLGRFAEIPIADA